MTLGYNEIRDGYTHPSIIYSFIYLAVISEMYIKKQRDAAGREEGSD